MVGIDKKIIKTAFFIIILQNCGHFHLFGLLQIKAVTSDMETNVNKIN